MEYLALIRHEWRLLALGVLLMFSSSFGQTWFVSLHGGELRAAFGLSHGEFGGLYSLATLVGAVGLAWIGKWVDEVDLRLFMSFVFVGLAISSVILAISPIVPMLLLSLVGLRLCGQGLMTHTAMTTMARGFDVTRGRAIGIAVLGITIGQAFLPALFVFLGTVIGWRMSWLLAAGALVGVLTTLVAMAPSQCTHPVATGCNADGRRLCG